MFSLLFVFKATEVPYKMLDKNIINWSELEYLNDFLPSDSLAIVKEDTAVVVWYGG